MFRKSLVAMATAVSLVSATAHAAPARVASPMSESENLDESQAWMLPVFGILAVAVIMLITDDGERGAPDVPVSP